MTSLSGSGPGGDLGAEPNRHAIPYSGDRSVQPDLVLSGSPAAYLNATEPKLRRIVTYSTQPDYPNPEFVSSISSPFVSPATGAARLSLSDGIYIVYLDVWKREITALNDPHIREVALNGPDTATRLQTVGQVRLLPVAALSPTLCDSAFFGWTRSPRLSAAG